MHRKLFCITLALIMSFSFFIISTAASFPSPLFARPEQKFAQNLNDFKRLLTELQSGGLIFINGEIIIDEPLYIKDTFSGPLAIGCAAPEKEGQNNFIHITKGGSLTIDASDIQMIADGMYRFMVIDDGGELILKNGSFDNMNAVSKVIPVLVNEGGRVYVSASFTLYEDHGDLFEGKGQVTKEKPEAGNGEGEQNEQDPEISGPSPKPPVTIVEEGEVVEVTKDKKVIIFFTMPLLQDSCESVSVEKSIDNGSSWIETAFYKKTSHNTDIFFADEKTGFSTWNYTDDTCSFLKYAESFEEINHDAIYRLKLTSSDINKEPEYTENISVVMPRTSDATGFIGTKDYGKLDGNRGGGGQGESERHPPHIKDDDDDDEKEHEKAPEDVGNSLENAENENSVPSVSVPQSEIEPEASLSEAPAAESSAEEKPEEQDAEEKKETIVEDAIPSSIDTAKPLQSFLPEKDRKGNIPGYASAVVLTAAAVCVGFIIGRKKS